MSSTTQSDPYVCATVCSECPFRKSGTQRFLLTEQGAQRIVRDLLQDKPFCCHQTTTPGGLDQPVTDPADWRFCAGAYLAMSEEQRNQHGALRVMEWLGFHDPDKPPAGEKVCFPSLTAFLQEHQDLER